jgi:hypothetical protein
MYGISAFWGTLALLGEQATLPNCGRLWLFQGSELLVDGGGHMLFFYSFQRLNL